MERLRLVGSLKLQVSFAKDPYKREDILQKRPIILRSLLIVATPYEWAAWVLRIWHELAVSRVTYESCCIWVMSHMSHVTDEWVTRLVSFVCVTWLIDMWRVMSHWYVTCLVSWICVTCNYSHVTYESCHIWVMSQMNELHDLFTYNMSYMHSSDMKATWRILAWKHSFIYDMTHSNITWLIHVWYDSFI